MRSRSYWLRRRSFICFGRLMGIRWYKPPFPPRLDGPGFARLLVSTFRVGRYNAVWSESLTWIKNRACEVGDEGNRCFV